ncbi:lasso RiPP family leader peptide-containing protein [Actinoplanes sp. NPDC051411]
MTEYEAPALVELGDFAELTAWYGWASDDTEGVAIV